jgi:hypothetical protein
VPGRGDAGRLLEIARWGAALGDLVPASAPGERDAILREAARFNLGVALFDSRVDDGSPHLPDLARALSYDRLRRRLTHPDDPDARLACADAENRALVHLFDEVLSSIGTRKREAKDELAHLSSLLERMYQSELGRSEDPFEAKRLPVVFIGELGSGLARDKTRALFDRLGGFLYLFDDWQDLADDLCALAPNAFFGPWRPDDPVGALLTLGRGASRTVTGPLAHQDLARALWEPLEASLRRAEALGSPTHGKVIAFLWDLLG